MYATWCCRASCRTRMPSTPSRTTPLSTPTPRSPPFLSTPRSLSHTGLTVPVRTPMLAQSCTLMPADAAGMIAPVWSPSGQDLARLHRPALSTQTVPLVVTRCLRLLVPATISSSRWHRMGWEACKLPWGLAGDWKPCLRMRTPG